MVRFRGVIDYEEVAKVIREEDSWRKGIKWYVGADPKSILVKGVRGDPPNLLCGWGTAKFYRMKNGNTLICDTGTHQVIEVNPEYEILWSFGKLNVFGTGLKELHSPEFVDYDEETDRVLIADKLNNRFLEVDRKTRVVTAFTSSALGPFGEIRSAMYNPFTGNFVVADETNHVVFEMDRTGAIIWSFGTYGTPGSTLSLLNKPFHAEMLEHEKDIQRVIISDFGNDRVLQVRVADGVVETLWVVPEPIHCQPKRAKLGLASGVERAVFLDTNSLLWYSWWIGSAQVLFTGNWWPWKYFGMHLVVVGEKCG